VVAEMRPDTVPRGGYLKAKVLLLLIPALSIVLTHVHTASSEVLSEEEVRALTWPAAIPMTLLAASDHEFYGGPDYVYRDPDAWLSESDVVEHSCSFPLSIRNTSIYPVDDVLLLIAHKGGTFSAMTIGGCAVNPGDFAPFGGAPFGPTGNRPGDGESDLYNAARGIVFLRINKGIPPESTLEVPVDILPEATDFVMHFDFYGLRRQNVFCSCPSTSDVTCRPALSPAATLGETWGRMKVLFAP